MKVRLFAALLAALLPSGLLHPGLAGAQHAGTESAGPDVPPGPADVVGRLVHETRPEAIAGVDVILYALGADGSGGLRQSTTDPDGGFRFEGVSNATDVVYLVGARADEIPFGSRFTFAPGELEHRVELVLSDPVSDAGAARPGLVEVSVERGCTHLRVSHTHALANPGERVVFVPEAQRSDTAPIFEVVLPEGHEGFEAIQGRDGLVREGDRVRFYGPVYPGAQEVEFGYGLPMDTTRIEIGLPGGAAEAGVLAPMGVIEVASEALDEAPEILLGGHRYALQRSGPIAPGGALAFDVSLAERAASRLTTPRAELWLELDDAALEANERLEVVVEAEGGLPESLGVPLLCLPLPTGALELRFSGDTLRAGLRRDPSGDIAIHGPLPPGPTQLAMSYRIPSRSRGVALTRRWDREVSLLSVLVADNGVVPETTRLHRRRAVRSDDRIFQHLEAFGVEALEPVEIDLRRTPPRNADTSWATTGFALLTGLAALGFLAAPLRGSAGAETAAPRPPASDAGEMERTAFAGALEDLDDDLDTGKISPEDHAAMRAELRARAAASLLHAPVAEPAREPEVEAAVQDDAAPPFCTACGHRARPGDAFCAKCGTRLETGAPV